MLLVNGSAVLSPSETALIAAILFATFFCVSYAQLRKTARVFLFLTLLLIVVVFLLAEHHKAGLELGLQRAVFYCGFFTALTFVRDVAAHSRLLQRAGRTITQQSPDRQYVVLSLGSHIFGLMMNFGALTMLGAMMQRSIAALPPGDRGTATRRAMIALLRGFAPTSTWSPLSVTPLVVVSVVPGVSWEAVLPIGFAAAIFMLLASWLVQRHVDPRPSRPREPNNGHRLDWYPLVGLLAIVALIFSAVIALRHLTGIGIAEAVTVILPCVTLLWGAVQCALGPVRPFIAVAASRLGGLLEKTLPSQSSEIVILSTAGFIGGVISASLPGRDAAAILGLLPFADLMLPLAAFWAVLVLGQFGVNPVISVTICGALIGMPEAFGIHPVFLAGVYLVAWSLTAQLSPFMASTLVLGNIAQVAASVIVNDWNRRFGLLAVGVSTMAIIYIGLALRP